MATSDAKKKARQLIAQELCGLWEGTSVRHTDGAGAKTLWTGCELYFNVENGKITGHGTSVWRNESIPFEIRGCFDRAMRRVELIKKHTQKYSSSIHYTLTLDAPKLKMQGTFAQGHLVLIKNRNWTRAASSAPPGFAPGDGKTAPSLSFAPGSAPAPLAMSREASDSTISSLASSAVSSAAASPSPSPPPQQFESSTTMAPAERFLKSLFGEKEGDKIHQLLVENEVDWEALKLMKDAHLKDVGIPMGPRVKIINALKVCNPDGSLPPGGLASLKFAPSSAASATASPPPSETSSPQPKSPVEVAAAAGAGAAVGAGVGNLNSETGGHPPDFVCPITRELMLEPVVCADGHTYERAAIAKWFEGHKTSPITGLILRTKELRPNHALRSLIQEYKQRRGIA